MGSGTRTVARIIGGFVAGFLAVPAFHQAALLALHRAGTAPAPWDLAPVPPVGVPAVASGRSGAGSGGSPFVPPAPRFGRGAGYWLAGLLFGAVALTPVAWFVVLPLKGLPPGGGFAWPGVIIGPVVNGAWGLGTALLLAALPGTRPRRA